MNRRETMAKTNRSSSLNLSNLGAIHDIIKNLIKIDTEERIDTSQEKLKGYYKQQKQLNRRMSRLQMERRAELASMRRKTLDETSLQSATSLQVESDAQEDTAEAKEDRDTQTVVVMDEESNAIANATSPTVQSPILAHRKISADLGFESGFETEENDETSKDDPPSDSSDLEKFERQLDVIREDIHDLTESRETGTSSSSFTTLDKNASECRSLVIEQEQNLDKNEVTVEPKPASSLPLQTAECDRSFSFDDVKFGDKFVHMVRVQEARLHLKCKSPPSLKLPVENSGIPSDEVKKTERDRLNVQILKSEQECTGLSALVSAKLICNSEIAEKLAIQGEPEENNIPLNLKCKSSPIARLLSERKPIENGSIPTNEVKKSERNILNVQVLKHEHECISLSEVLAQSMKILLEDKTDKSDKKNVQPVSPHPPDSSSLQNMDKIKAESNSSQRAQPQCDTQQENVKNFKNKSKEKLNDEENQKNKTNVQHKTNKNDVVKKFEAKFNSQSVTAYEQKSQKIETEAKTIGQIVEKNSKPQLKVEKSSLKTTGDDFELSLKSETVIFKSDKINAKENSNETEKSVVKSNKNQNNEPTTTTVLHKDFKKLKRKSVESNTVVNEKMVQLISETCNQDLSRFVQCKTPIELSGPEVRHPGIKQEEKAEFLQRNNIKNQNASSSHEKKSRTSTFFLFDVLLKEANRKFAFQSEDAKKETNNNVVSFFRTCLKTIYKPHPAQRSHTVDLGKLLRSNKKWKPKWRRNREEAAGEEEEAEVEAEVEEAPSDEEEEEYDAGMRKIQEEEKPKPKPPKPRPVDDDEPQKELSETEKALLAQKRKHEAEESERLKDYEEQRRKEREREEEELKILKEKQERRRKEREEEEALMEERRRVEEERRKADEEARKQKAEADKARKDEEKKKKQAMMAGLQATPGKNFEIPQKDANQDKFDKFGNIVKAKAEMGETKEQHEEQKKKAMAEIIKSLDLSGLDIPAMRAKIKELHQRICRLEADRYDLERRQERQVYDLKELNERQRQIARNKAMKKGLNPEEAANSRHPPKMPVASKYDRQTDRRSYGDRRVLFENPHKPKDPRIFHGSARPPSEWGRRDTEELEIIRSKNAERPKYVEAAPIEGAKPPMAPIPTAALAEEAPDEEEEE